MKKINIDLLLIYILLKFNSFFNFKKVRLLSGRICFTDLRALLYEMYYIFKNEIYYFNTEEVKPFIIDGGSHIGTSVVYFKKLYPKSEIIAFEPDESIFALLKNNLRINGIDDVKIVQSGLFERDELLNFNADGSDGGKIEDDGGKVIKVERLSKYINKKVDFLKLNIEGSELSVIRDLNSSDKLSLVKEMVIEWHSFSGQKQSLAEILKILEDNGYKYFIGIFLERLKANILSIIPLNFFY
jgi:FkbM family methyltransferase